MILLDDPGKSLSVSLAGAVTTNQLQCVCSYKSITRKYSGQQGSLNSYVPFTIENEFDIEADTLTNSTSLVTIAPAPQTSDDVWIYSHEVRTISIYNADTTSATVIVWLNAGTDRVIIKCALAVGASLHYGGGRWYAINSDGSEPTPLATDVSWADLDSYLRYTAYNGWIACSDDQISADPTSNGTTVTLTVEKDGGGDININWSTGPAAVDCTPALTIALTVGTDAAPQINYVYILFSAPTVLTKSTTGFPSAEFHPIGTYLVPSAATAQTYGLYKAHNWTDHIYGGSGTNGHLQHINSWIRQQPATWVSGCLLTPTLSTVPSPDTLTIAVATGVIRQLHNHDFPAFDSSTGGSTAATTFLVTNKSGDAYDPGKDLYNYKLTSSGGAASNNDRIIWVVWGVVSDNGVDCKVMVNLPSGFYTTDALAIADSSGYGNYNIPAEFTGTGFLIAKLTYKYTSAGGGGLTLVENIDLRGKFPSLAAGGASSATEFLDSVFLIENVTDPTKQIAFSAGSITTGTTRTLTVQDKNITVAGIDDVYFTITYIGAALSPADSTTYYMGLGRITPSTTATNHDDIIDNIAFTIIGAVITAANNTVSGSTEDNTLQLRNVTDATSTTIGVFDTDGSTTVSRSTTISGLSIAVGAGESICLQWDTPAYATNPTNCILTVMLICKRS